jgi:hypothetical protein
MNRIVTYGLTGFFALIGICLIDGPKEAKAFHGWQIYGGWGCQGCHPWHGNQRCYSGNGCSGCQGCYGSVGQCCASSGCGGCSGYQRCYGCYGCEGAIDHSCHGCYGGCSGYGGYYQSAAPTIVVSVEPTPVVGPPVSFSGRKTTLQVVTPVDGEFSFFSDDNAIALGGNAADGTVFDRFIYEPR